MENEKLVITKDNYKGYVELYKERTTTSEKEYDCSTRWGIKALTVGFIAFLLVVANLAFPYYPLALKLEIVLFFVAEFVIRCDYNKKHKMIEKEKDNLVKEKYSYVDIEISTNELKKALCEAKILIYEYKNNDRFEYLEIEKYENYLKCEEEKEKYFEETKYDGYVVNPKIQPEELEKVEEKVKKLVR